MDNNNKDKENRDLGNKTNNICEVICGRIAQLRRRDRLSQEALANMLGITFQAVSKWENNVSCPDISILPDIAKIFHVPVGWLFGEEVCNDESNGSRQDFTKGNTAEGENAIPCDWANDDIVRVVVARGNKLIKSQELDENIKQFVSVELNEDINGGVINSQLNICISGNIEVSNSTFHAGANINCGDITEGEAISAGGRINCGDISEGKTITAGDSINCGDITEGGTITGGNSINCGDINTAEIVSAGNNISCGDISDCTKVEVHGALKCGDLYGCGGVQC